MSISVALVAGWIWKALLIAAVFYFGGYLWTRGKLNATDSYTRKGS